MLMGELSDYAVLATCYAIYIKGYHADGNLPELLANNLIE
jgi:hypothetical protein